MTGLTTETVATACRLFLEMAYPAGVASVPEKRRLYAHLPPGHDFAAYQGQNLFPAATFQTLSNGDGAVCGYALRLGSAGFPHLKLKIQWLEDGAQKGWIFAVDTHDAFSRESRRPPDGHPDAEAWSRLQRANAELKEKIERAWEHAGLVTFNAVLRQGLSRSASGSAAQGDECR